jgi:hypothetical protein
MFPMWSQAARSANFAHLDNQSDSEKKKQDHSKALGEKRSNPGSFWFTAVSGSFFQRHKDFRVASLASGCHKRCTSSTYCVSLLSYSIAVDIRRLQCNMQYEQADVFQANNTCWRLACVADLVRASSQSAVLRSRRASPKNCLLVPGTSWLQSSFPMHHTHTSSFSSTGSTY